ncbi:MAG TPA: ABC transporter permease [Acidobacteriota bacterium]|nr:ABC transporter permease [Acidobacteriota bacterium]
MAEAIKRLARAKTFTLAAVFLISTGLSFNLSVFSLLERTLFRELSYQDADRLVVVQETWLDTQQSDIPLSPGEFRQASGSLQVFSGAFAYFEMRHTVSAGGTTGRVRAGYAVGDPLKVLGIRPLVGTGLIPSLTIKEVVLSHALWQSLYGGRKDIVGETLELDGQPFAVIGVMPKHSGLPRLEFDLWTRWHSPAILSSNFSWHTFHTIARLQADVTLEIARKTCNTIVRRAHGNDHARSASLLPLYDDLLAQHGTTLFVLQAVGLVLIAIILINLSGLWLVRSLRRRHETALRKAFGARSGHLILGPFFEGLLIALASCAVTLLLLPAWSKFLVELAPPRLTTPDAGSDPLNVAVLALTASLVSAALASMPAWWPKHADDPLQLFRSVGPGVGDAWLWRAALVFQLALSVLLVSLSGQFLVSLNRLSQTDTGYAVDNLLLAEGLPLPSDAEGLEMRRRLVRSLEHEAWLRGAAFASSFPLAAASEIVAFRVVREDQSAFEAPHRAAIDTVSPGYFELMGIAVIAGDSFASSLAAAQGVIVNRTLAEEVWPRSSDVVGKLIRLPGDLRPQVIIGVAEDVFSPFNASSPMRIYRKGYQGEMLVVRTSSHAEGLSKPFSDILMKWSEPGRITPAAELFANLLRDPEFRAQLVFLCALQSLLLTATGLFGAFIQLVRSRRRELAIRMALGAGRLRVLTFISRQALLLLATGISGGLFLDFAARRFLPSSTTALATDARWPLYTAVLAVVLAAGLLALSPALRLALKTDPASYLRD